jgi:hypothetical protein
MDQKKSQAKKLDKCTKTLTTIGLFYYKEDKRIFLQKRMAGW